MAKITTKQVDKFITSGEIVEITDIYNVKCLVRIISRDRRYVKYTEGSGSYVRGGTHVGTIAREDIIFLRSGTV